MVFRVGTGHETNKTALPRAVETAHFPTYMICEVLQSVCAAKDNLAFKALPRWVPQLHVHKHLWGDLSKGVEGRMSELGRERAHMQAQGDGKWMLGDNRGWRAHVDADERSSRAVKHAAQHRGSIPF
jgi:hypothetical protein